MAKRPIDRKRAVIPAPGGIERARELRSNMSLPEVLLWQLLRRRSVHGLLFRRQKPLGPFVADFYCHEAMLVVEVDGKQHEFQVEHDRARDRWLKDNECGVLRVAAAEVLKDPAAVAEWVVRAARERIAEIGARENTRK